MLALRLRRVHPPGINGARGGVVVGTADDTATVPNFLATANLGYSFAGTRKFWGAR